MSHPARHPDGSRWNPNYDRGEGQYSDYPPRDPRARGDSPDRDSHCVDCGKRFKEGETKFTPIGGGGSLCKNCHHERFGKFQMGGDDRDPNTGRTKDSWDHWKRSGRKKRPPPDDDDDPHDFFPFPRQGGSPPPTAGAAAVRKRKVVYY